VTSLDTTLPKYYTLGSVMCVIAIYMIILWYQWTSFNVAENQQRDVHF